MNGVPGYAHRFIKDFKVTHKKMKGVEDSVAYFGFPATSLEKYTPENATVEICKCGRFLSCKKTK
ncbi:MAG: hypothetical protein KBT33_10065 [Prevotellaceae bacterium]|nr:hypothetical protein [Candidatus Minthosoma equi]